MMRGSPLRPIGRSKGVHAVRSGAAGFTIVEVLIVLSVTGAMFISAFTLINGKQDVASFNQSIRNVQTELQQVVTEVGSGHYPNNGTFKCDKDGPGGGTDITAGTTAQGANLHCLFLGRAIQFAVGTTVPEVYNVYTVVGLRGSAASPSTNLATAKARLLARSASAADAAIPDNAYDTKRLLYGLAVSQPYLTANPGTSYASFAITSKLGVIGASDASQQIDIVPIANSILHDTKAAGVSKINAALPTATPNPAQGIDICFNSGSTNQSGKITIGGSGRQGTINLKIYGTKDCV
jgi:type II secretory pathway pseudopilin PulG